MLCAYICTSHENMRRIQLISPANCKKLSRPHSNYIRHPRDSLPKFFHPSVRPFVRAFSPARRIIKTQIETRTIIHEILARGHETKPDLIRLLIRLACSPPSFLCFTLRRESHEFSKTKHSKLDFISIQME